MLGIDYLLVFVSWGSLGARNIFDHICWQAEASGVCKGGAWPWVQATVSLAVCSGTT